MKTERPNADIIRAYADGQEIEYYFGGHNAKWLTYDSDCIAIGHPNYEWRIKPETLQYRIALMQSVDSSTFWLALQSRWDDNLEKHPKFVKWVTDLEEVEVW
jgi:hypothetical protein